MRCILFSPLPVKPGGTLGFLAVCHSVCPSVRLSVCQSTRCPSTLFSELFSVFLWDIDLTIWYVNLSWHNTDQVWVSLRLTYFYRSYCPLLKFSFPAFFSAVFWDIDLKYGIWICLDTIQIKFGFHYAWSTFIGVIALCWNLVFRTFLCCLLRYWLEFWYMNLSWHNTDQVRVLSRLDILL